MSERHVNGILRYQFCPPHVKLWRRRHYLKVPFTALQLWWYSKKDEDPFTLGNSWSIATGMADGDMYWLYDWEDVKKELKHKYPVPKSL